MGLRAPGCLVPLRPRLPRCHGVGVHVIMLGQFGEALLTRLDRATHRRGRAGAAVQELSHQASRDGTSFYGTPSHLGTRSPQLRNVAGAGPASSPPPGCLAASRHRPREATGEDLVRPQRPWPQRARAARTPIGYGPGGSRAAGRHLSPPAWPASPPSRSQGASDAWSRPRP